MALVKVRRKYQITLPSEARKNIRIGEKVEDLIPFNPREFVNSLFLP